MTTTVTGFTAEHMQEIEDGIITGATIVSGHLVFTKHDGSTVDVGSVAGPAGPTGPTGPASVYPCLSSAHPANPTAAGNAYIIYETDTHKFFYWDGSAWSLPISMPQGFLGQGSYNVGYVTLEGSPVELTYASITVPASRRIRITAVLMIRSVAGDESHSTISESLNGGAETTIQESEAYHAGGVSGLLPHAMQIIRTPPAGTHRYRLYGFRASGTGPTSAAASATFPITIHVEDIGPA